MTVIPDHSPLYSNPDMQTWPIWFWLPINRTLVALHLSPCTSYDAKVGWCHWVSIIWHSSVYMYNCFALPNRGWCRNLNQSQAQNILNMTNFSLPRATVAQLALAPGFANAVSNVVFLCTRESFSLTFCSKMGCWWLPAHQALFEPNWVWPLASGHGTRTQSKSEIPK